MGNLVITEFVTLDGVMQDPGGAEKDSFPQGGWAFAVDRSAEGDAFKMEELQAADVQLLGRVTYEGFAKAWPSMGGSPFGDKMNSMPKVVVSSTLENPTWNATVANGDLAEIVADLKAKYNGNILVQGSCTLARALLSEGLVDELRLMVYPQVLGTGKRLLGDGVGIDAFRFADVKQLGGVVAIVLRREAG